MSEAVIVDAIRTPVGRAIRGTLRDIRADDLAAIPLRALIERNPEVDFSETVDVMMGCGFPDHEQGYNIARNAALLAGLDHHIPAVTVNRFCASSLQTIRMAFHAIKAGEGDQYIAAGVECHLAGRRHDAPGDEPAARGLKRHRLQRLHPDGDHGRERGRALQGQPRSPGRVGGAVPGTRRRRARERPLRPRDRGGGHSGDPRRRRRRHPRAHRHRETTGRGRARRWRRCRSSSPPSSRVAA